jgi:hypothetical protein
MGRDSPSDLRSAVKSLSRIKALETRAGSSRVIWHKGTDSELLSWVDSSGRVLKQMLVLFDDVVLWQHSMRLRTGQVKARTDLSAQLTMEDIEFDGMPEKNRHGRAKLGTSTYDGADKYILHLARVVEPTAALAGAAVVTRASNDVLQRQYKAMATRARNKQLLIAGGVLIVALSIALFVALLSRH